MRPIKWHFDMMPEHVYDGFTDDTRWNGFLNVWVTPQVRDGIVAEYRGVEDIATADEMAELPIGTDGLVSFAGGYTTIEAL